MTRTKTMITILLFLIITSIILTVIAFAPFSLVWAINVLFGMHNDYNYESWLASVIFLFVAAMLSSIFRR